MTRLTVDSPLRHIDSYRPLLAALRAEGVDPAQLLRELGIDPEAHVTGGPHALPTALTLLERAIVLRGEGFPARAAAHLRLDELGVLGLALLASPTVGDALDRALRYRRLVFESDDYLLEADSDPAVLARRPLSASLATRHPVGARALAELGLIEHVVALRALSSADDETPWELRLAHPPPEDGGAAIERAACVRARFGAPRDELRFPRALLAMPTRHGHPALATFFDGLASERLAAETLESVADRVRRHLRRELRGRAPGANATARALGMSERTLSRRLTAESSSFPSLLDEVRRDVALGLLRRPDIPLAEIAFVLGFSELRAFHRAFRRWTGRTPAQARSKS